MRRRHEVHRGVVAGDFQDAVGTTGVLLLTLRESTVQNPPSRSVRRRRDTGRGRQGVVREPDIQRSAWVKRSSDIACSHRRVEVECRHDFVGPDIGDLGDGVPLGIELLDRVVESNSILLGDLTVAVHVVTRRAGFPITAHVGVALVHRALVVHVHTAGISSGSRDAHRSAFQLGVVPIGPESPLTVVTTSHHEVVFVDEPVGETKASKLDDVLQVGEDLTCHIRRRLGDVDEIVGDDVRVVASGSGEIERTVLADEEGLLVGIPAHQVDGGVGLGRHSVCLERHRTLGHEITTVVDTVDPCRSQVRREHDARQPSAEIGRCCVGELLSDLFSFSASCTDLRSQTTLVRLADGAGDGAVLSVLET